MCRTGSLFVAAEASRTACSAAGSSQTSSPAKQQVEDVGARRREPGASAREQRELFQRREHRYQPGRWRRVAGGGGLIGRVGDEGQVEDAGALWGVVVRARELRGGDGQEAGLIRPFAVDTGVQERLEDVLRCRLPALALRTTSAKSGVSHGCSGSPGTSVLSVLPPRSHTCAQRSHRRFSERNALPPHASWRFPHAGRRPGAGRLLSVRTRGAGGQPISMRKRAALPWSVSW